MRHSKDGLTPRRFLLTERYFMLYYVLGQSSSVLRSASVSAGVFRFSHPAFLLSPLSSTFTKVGPFCTILVQFNPSKSFRINTCKTDTKQTTLTSFRINTYAKPPGGRVRTKTSNLECGSPAAAFLNRSHDSIFRETNRAS